MPTKSEIKGPLMAKLTDGSYVEITEGISLEEAETIAEQYDFVRVVRCRDCKWYKTMYCKMDRWTDLVTVYVAKADDYCSYGERKEK